MKAETTVDPTNGGAPSVYTIRLELSQAWFDALYGARSQPRDVPHAPAAAAPRTCATRSPSQRMNGSTLASSRATASARATVTAKVEMTDRIAVRSSRAGLQTTRIPAVPAARSGRVVVLRGNDGLAIAIAYTERGLSIAARRAGPRTVRALERACEALVAQGIVHRTFIQDGQASEQRND